MLVNFFFKLILILQETFQIHGSGIFLIKRKSLPVNFTHSVNVFTSVETNFSLKKLKFSKLYFYQRRVEDGYFVILIVFVFISLPLASRDYSFEEKESD